MNNEELAQALDRICRKYSRADYILGEVQAHLVGNATRIDKEFFDWFIKQWAKYQKGE